MVVGAVLAVCSLLLSLIVVVTAVVAYRNKVSALKKKIQVGGGHLNVVIAENEAYGVATGLNPPDVMTNNSAYGMTACQVKDLEPPDVMAKNSAYGMTANCTNAMTEIESQANPPDVVAKNSAYGSQAKDHESLDFVAKESSASDGMTDNETIAYEQVTLV